MLDRRDDPGGGIDQRHIEIEADHRVTHPRQPTGSVRRMRSLADDLRHRDDDALAELLRARPDLLHPVPTDLGALATRAGSATSVARALDSLDRFTLQVAETIAALDEPATGEQIRACFDGELAAPVDAAVDRLVDLALVWGEDPYRMVRTARDAFGPQPGDLGPPALDLRPRLALLSVGSLRETLAQAPEKAVELLESMMWGPAVGQVDRADRVVTIDTASTPIEWLLARDLLVPRGPTTVTLPREVGLALREIHSGAPRVIKDVAWPARAPRVIAERDINEVDRACGVHALAAVDAISDLLEYWSTDAPSVLRSGGLAVRDLSLTARTLDTDEATAAIWIEWAYAAGLLARDGDFDEAWRPTAAYDDWLADSPAERWAHLVESWWHGTRAPELIRGEAQADPPPRALSDGVVVVSLPDLRAEVFAVLADCPVGAAIDPDDIGAVLEDRHPRTSSPARIGHIRAALKQAELLGVTGFTALGTAGQLLVDHAPAADLASAIAPHLPEPVEQVMIQGDLTAIAPGPLRLEAARTMRLLADVESSGTATVYRFTEASLRRGFDAGRDAEGILDSLTELSATPLPQALEYLVTDLGRKHGRLRVGIAGCYLRSDDPTLVRAALAAADGIDLVEIAPGVLVSSEAPDRVLAALRSAGLTPLAETPDGRVITAPSRPQRAPARHVSPIPTQRRTPRSALVDAAVTTLRATAPIAQSSEVSEGSNVEPPSGSTRETLATLRAALAEGQSVRLGYVDTEGERRTMLATPVRLAPGTLTAMDHTVGQVRVFTLARITGAVTVR